MRARRLGAVLAAIATCLACKTVEDPLPPQASLNVDVTDSAVATQLSPFPAPQIASFKVDELSASGIPGFDGTYSFLFSGPCFYQLNVAAPISFGASCRTSGLTLHPNSSQLTASFRFSISHLELRTAARPDLSPGGDPDGDGVPTASDNCPIVYNPDQANFNVNSEVLRNGDACSQVDTSGLPSVPDQDLDGVTDFLDSCLWYPSPAAAGSISPPDSNNDGIGDACERVAPVVLPNGRLTMECDDVPFNARGSTIAFFRFDFGQPGVLTCDPGFSGCTVDPSAIKIILAGTPNSYPCHQVP